MLNKLTKQIAIGAPYDMSNQEKARFTAKRDLYNKKCDIKRSIYLYI